MEEEEPPYSYSRPEVIRLLGQQRADVKDYLILTYFMINKITDGPLYQKYRRRLNNIIVNNFTEASKRLTRAVFKPKAEQFLVQELSRVRYVSVIYPNINKGVSPVIVQFFTPEKGIQHRILDFPYGPPMQMGGVLIRYRILSKLVGYCGDYCYKDSAFANCTCDLVTSLRTLSRNRILDLPYSETFMNRLFDILLDYLPEDVIKPVVKLGETLMGFSSNSSLAGTIVRKYKVWLNNSHHILLSDYLRYVIANFDAINSYLLPCQNLPKCIESLFGSVMQRFLLVFMSEFYHKINQIKLQDNSAVVYYFHLTKILDQFKAFHSNHYFPTKAWDFLSNQVDQLIESKEINAIRDQAKLDNLYKDVTVLVDETYARAIKYMEPLLKQFDNFSIYAWALLDENDLPVKFEEVHDTYHVLHPASCENCHDLQQEVKILNTVLATLPLLEITSVISRWVLVMRMCPNDKIPTIITLLEYLFSLPSNYTVANHLGGKDEFDCTKKFVKINLISVKHEDVVDKIEEFFDGYMAEAKQAVSGGFVSVLED